MTNQRIICRWLSGAILLGCFCVSGGAAVLEYTTQSSFTAATSGVTTVTFTGPGTNSSVSYSNSTGYVSNGADFIGYDNASGPSGYDLKNTDNLPDWGSGAYLDGPGSFGSSNNAGITVFLPTNTFAVGTNFMSPGHDQGTGQPDSEAQNFQVLLSTGPTVYTITSLAGFTNMAFVGFTSDTAITSITFSPQSGNRTDLDNFQFGQVAGSSGSATPETTTALLCGGGLILMGQLLRRRKNSLPAMA
jgi:hypothetical protein